MSLKLIWIPTAAWKAKNPNKSTDFCMIGETRDSGEFYSTKDVTENISNIKVGSNIDIEFKEVAINGKTSKVLTSIREATSSQKENNKEPTDLGTQASIEKQVAAKATAEIIKALQGQVSVNEINEIVANVFDTIYNKIVG